VASIAPGSPKPTIFLDGKGNLSLNHPSGQQELSKVIPDSEHMRNAASESKCRNGTSDIMNGDNNGEIPRFRPKTTQARKRNIVISDDEDVKIGIGFSLLNGH
jgi:hypothetical protein